MEHFGQILTAMVTPFKKDLSVNYQRAAELALYLLKNGSEGLVVSGTTGESPTLSKKEKIELFKVVKDAVGKKGKVIAGTGNYCTEESIELTRQAEKVGVDGCMLVTPYYNKPPQRGLINHFKAIANSTSLPVILYNIPSRTACNIEAETVLALCEVENIVALKEAGGDFGQISKIVAGTPDDFYVYSGQDEWNLPLMALGAVGAISVAAHLVGRQLQKMFTAYKNGAHLEALKIHSRLMPLFKALFITTNPIMVKAGVNLMGIDVGALRPPLLEATREEKAKLKEVMRKLKII